MTLKKCPSCGHSHDSEDIVCPYCKYSYSEKKFVCNNCGAYLQPTDKVCYVCGKVAELQKVDVPEPEIIDEKEVNYVDVGQQSVDINNVDTYADEPEDAERVNQDNSEKISKKTKKKSNKIAIICVAIVIAVALIATGICVCYYKGWIPKEEEIQQVNMTIYFDKPFSNQNLMDSQGVVYHWTGDVDINYDFNGQTFKKPCTMTKEYDNIWYYEIPYNAKNVYFSQSTGDFIRTALVPELIDDTIYYVSDVLFNNGMQLPIKSCLLKEFDNFGVNYTEATFDSEATVESSIVETEETQDAATEPEFPWENDDKAVDYSVSLPEQWQENTLVIKNGNCTSYYEKYNYDNYQCGMLMAVYIFDANDNSYSEMNVSKVIPADDGSKIVVVTPTDIQFDDSDETAIQKYTDLSQYTNQVVESVQEN